MNASREGRSQSAGSMLGGGKPLGEYAREASVEAGKEEVASGVASGAPEENEASAALDNSKVESRAAMRKKRRPRTKKKVEGMEEVVEGVKCPS